MPDNEVKLDLSKPKAPSVRIDLSKTSAASAAPAPAAPAPSIRLSPTPPPSPARISITPPAAPSVAPVAPVPPKAATGPIGVADVEDIYKRRTALLDTSKIPMASSTPANAPRTVKIGGRPTIRIGGNQSGSTYSPGHPEESGAKPAIRLKRPGGAISVPANASSSSSSIAPAADGFVISKAEDDEPGAIWAVLALLGLLVAGALIYFQVISMQLAAHA